MLSRFAQHNTLQADIDGALVKTRVRCRDRVLLSRARMVTQWLGEVARRHLTTPALIGLEMSRPLNFICEGPRSVCSRAATASVWRITRSTLRPAIFLMSSSE